MEMTKIQHPSNYFLHFHRHDIISHPLSVQLLYAHPVRQAANNNVNNTEEIMF